MFFQSNFAKRSTDNNCMNYMKRPIKISVESIPEELVFVREIAKRNNPAFLERNDFDDALNTLGISPDGTGFDAPFFVCGNILDSRTRGGTKLTLQPGSPWSLQFYQVCAESPFKLLTASEEPEEKGLQRAAKLFGERGENILVEMRRGNERLRDLIPETIQFSDKLKEDPRILKVLEEAPARLKERVKKYSKDYGVLTPSFRPPYGVVIFGDTKREDLSDNAILRSGVKAEFDIGEGTIFFRSELVAREGLDKRLDHEANHLWLASVCGETNYKKIPVWFREGLAVVSAGQLEEKRDASLSSADQETLVTDYANPAERFKRDYEYYPAALSVQILIERYGKKRIGRLILEVREGASFADALKKVIPGFENEEKFYDSLTKEVARRVSVVATEEAQKAYAEIMSTNMYLHYDDHLWAEPYLRYQVKLCEKFLQKHSRSPYAIAVHCRVGLAYYQLGELKKARGHLQRVVEKPRHFAGSEYAFFYLAFMDAPQGAEGIPSLVELGKKTTPNDLRKFLLDEMKRRNSKAM